MSDTSKIDAIEELLSIVECDSKLERHARFFTWKNKWIVEVSKHQLVMDRSRMSSDDHDFACEYLAKLCVEELMDKNMVSIEVNKNSYTATLLAIKNGKFKKN